MEISLKEICFFLICGNFVMVIGSRDCSLSIETVKEVASCPLSKAEVEDRKQKKNCEAIAKLQNCTEPQNFLYHCVINDLEDALVEVCAPAYIINSYCAEFNFGGALIQQHFNLKCSYVKPPCAARYNSTDAYLYPGCYDMVKNVASTSNAPLTKSTIGNSLDEQGDLSDIPLVTGLVVGALFACLIIVLLVIWKIRKKRNALNEGEGDEEELLDREDSVYFNTVNDGHFVETTFSNKSFQKLEDKGIVFLIGKPGSGKTDTALHILYSEKYKDWHKECITSVAELKDIKQKGKTLVFIDNLFDGFDYRKEVKQWWETLLTFYSNYIMGNGKVRLIITIKDRVMEKARIFIEARDQDIVKSCSLDANSLSEDENVKILHSQFELANRLKKMELISLSDHQKSQLPKQTPIIGFPLCAHMYAFEHDKSTRDIALIFSNPSFYVLHHIESEIRKDETNGVKTLFLLLLFYFRQDGSHSNQKLDLTSEKNCSDFFQKLFSKEMLKEIGPLSFKNLHEKAKALEGIIILKNKNNNVYEFKHQIYLEGVSNYFFRHHFNSVFKTFPFHILIPCGLPDLSRENFQIFMKRLIQELKKGHFFEVLSRDIFKDQKYEETLCQLDAEKPFLELLLKSYDATTAFHLPISFWASKYNLKKLVQVLLTLAEKREEYFQLQFYSAMFSECCAVDEMYIRSTKPRPSISHLQKSVFKFRCSERKTIMHVLVSSEKSDCDAHRFLTKILDESQETDLHLDNSVVDTALRQTKRSRLMCLLEILHRIKGTNKAAKPGDHYIPFDGFVNDSENDMYYKLECSCRICILNIYGEYSFTENRGREELEKIKTYLQSLEGNSAVAEAKIPPMPETIPADWRTAIAQSIQILAKQEKNFHSECNKKQGK